jgi:hypothetical protein
MGTGGSRCNVALARPSSWTLPGYDGPGHEKLATPNTPRFAPFERSREAFRTDWAGLAQGLCQLDVRGGLGEEELGVVDPTGQGLRVDRIAPDPGVDHAECHVVHLLRFLVAGQITKKPRFPVWESAAWRCRS